MSPQNLLNRACSAMWLILSLVLLSLSAIVAGNLYSEYNHIVETENEHMSYQIKTITNIINSSVISLNSALESLTSNEHAIDSVEELNHHLDFLSDVLNGVQTFAVYDKNGIIQFSNEPSLIGQDFSFRPYFKTVKKLQDPELLYIGAPFLNALGTYTITATRMIQGHDGEFDGLVLATLDPMFFIPMLESVLYAPDMWISILHADGTVFLTLSQHQTQEELDQIKPGTLFVKHLNTGEKAHRFIDRDPATGERRLMATNAIRPKGISTDHPLYVGISRDFKRVLEIWRRDAFIQLFLFVCLSALAISSIGVLQNRRKKQEARIAEAESSLAERNRFIHMVTDNVPGSISYWDKDVRCQYANKAYLDWLGITPEQMLGASMRQIIRETTYEEITPHIQAVLGGESQTFERNVPRPDGNDAYVLVRYIPDIVDQEIKGFYSLVSDVTELKNTQTQLEEKVEELAVLASTDPLTGLSNRRYFLNRAKEEFSRSKRYDIPLSFLMIDVDFFKRINDQYGHDVGDEVLKSLARALMENLRESDFVGRLGGEEFGLLLTQTDTESAREAAERLRKVLKELTVQHNDQSIHFSVSIGLATFEQGLDSLEDLMKSADVALYHAKEHGRDRVSCFGQDCQIPEASS